MKFLIELIPAGQRKILYAVLSFALAVYAIFLATQGDWREFAVSLVTALVTTLATANTDVDIAVDETDELPPDDYTGGYDAAIRADGGYVSVTGLVASVVVVLLILGLVSLLGWI